MVIVDEETGADCLRRGWIDQDLLRTAALVLAGMMTIPT
jgi:hypothetical protein